MELLRHASRHLKRPAVAHQRKVYTYESLLKSANEVGRAIAQQTSKGSGGEPPRVGLYAAPGPEYVAGTLAIWKAGCIAVPLATSHPPPELTYVLQDAGISMVLANEDERVLTKLSGVTRPRSVPLLTVSPPDSHDAASFTAPPPLAEDDEWGSNGSEPGSEQGALIIYTSGTTGKPKGALHSHRSLGAQMTGLIRSWQWSGRDRITHCLPLHHIHGIVNALYCPLAVGAQVDVLPKFSPSAVWNRMMDGRMSVFMGVPTMYALLLQAFDAMGPEQQAKAAAAAAGLRLTVSGSSACPVPIMERWKALSGQYLLERYGMTEIGMALSNPYTPARDRRPGAVGYPLPGVTCRIAEDGELLVQGGTLFSQYWGRPEATAEAFTPQGEFKTGDSAAATPDDQGVLYYTILGRTSVDIIKSGGYKLSALQIENVLLEHPGLSEVAVLGLEDDVYGEVVVALVVPKQAPPPPTADPPTPPTPSAAVTADSDPSPSPPLSAEQHSTLVEGLRQHCLDRLAPYQAPRRYLVIPALPRNAMGKVNKKELKRVFGPQLLALAPARS